MIFIYFGQINGSVTGLGGWVFQIQVETMVRSQVWFPARDYDVDCSELEITCRYSNSRAPGYLPIKEIYTQPTLHTPRLLPFHDSQQVQIWPGLSLSMRRHLPKLRCPGGSRGRIRWSELKIIWKNSEFKNNLSNFEYFDSFSL